MAAYETAQVRRSGDRFTTVDEGLTTRHLLSFGGHYDADLTSFGPLVAHNDETVEPGAGYPPHRHVGVEIVTWVVAGRLLHADDVAGESELDAGGVQVLSAGAGVTHSERSSDGGGPTRFVHMWLTSDEPSAAPAHRRAQVDPDLASAELVPIASGRSDVRGATALPLRQSRAVCYAGRLSAGEQRTLPDAPLVHVFVVSGAVSLGADVVLSPGDSVLLRATRNATCTATDDAEIVAWALDGDG